MLTANPGQCLRNELTYDLLDCQRRHIGRRLEFDVETQIQSQVRHPMEVWLLSLWDRMQDQLNEELS